LLSSWRCTSPVLRIAPVDPEPLDPKSIDWERELGRPLELPVVQPVTRECPWCKSAIAPGARICPFCRKESPPAAGTPEAQAQALAQALAEAEARNMDEAVGTAMVVAGVVLLLLVVGGLAALNPNSHLLRDDGAVVVLCVVVALVCGAVGAACGSSRRRPTAGFWLGFFLGPLGCALALFLPLGDEPTTPVNTPAPTLEELESARIAAGPPSKRGGGYDTLSHW